jgi:hypothetical protein
MHGICMRHLVTRDEHRVLSSALLMHDVVCTIKSTGMTWLTGYVEGQKRTALFPLVGL